MRRALNLAVKGLGLVQPNPMVGAVLVYNNRIIGEGYHQKFGDPHAEVIAIRSATENEKLIDSVLYVTLEPCVHFGKTPPCTDLIIQKNIGHVVIASTDPFTEVNGKGILKLQNAGVKVTTGILKQEADFLNRRFFIFHLEKRPYIILKWAKSTDGFIDPVRSPDMTGSVNISSEFSRTLSHKWRTEEQAIVVGRVTAMNDNPFLTPRLYTGKQPLRILIDKDLKVPTTNNIFSGGHPTMVINDQLSTVKGNVLYNRIDFNDFFRSFNQLLFEHSIQSVIIEGGAFTLQQFIDSGNWDEARIFTSNAILKEGTLAPEFHFNHSDEIETGTDKLRVYYKNSIV